MKLTIKLSPIPLFAGILMSILCLVWFGWKMLILLVLFDIIIENKR